MPEATAPAGSSHHCSASGSIKRERRKATARVLSDGTTGLSGTHVEQLGGTLEPGCAIAAVLVEHVWAEALEDAVSRTGGNLLAGEFVDATALTPELLARFMPPG